jgi:hypothetical protein
LPFACRADDDLASAPGDPVEASTAEALNWLGSGACTEVLPTEASPALRSTGWRVPRLRKPAAAQVYLPGLY